MAEWSALISRGQEKWLEGLRARVVTWLSLSSWSLSGFGNNATTIFFACQKQRRANVGNSIRVMFIRASKFLERKNISIMRCVCWSREEMSNGGKLEWIQVNRTILRVVYWLVDFFLRRLCL